MSQIKPILTIAVPTYNRAHLLRYFLPILLENVKNHGDEVEVVVSDNCSTDNTQSVLSELSLKYKFSYHRQICNIGAAKNIVFVADELAKGEFCWIIGDDDIVPPGSVTRVLNLLSQNPSVDYYFVSSAHFHIPEIEHLLGASDLVKEINPFVTAPKSTVCGGPRNNLLELIDPRIREEYLGFIGNSIFRRSLWLQMERDFIKGDEYSNWKSAFPHVYIFATKFYDKPAYFCPEHLILEGEGGREWQNSYIMVMCLLHLDQILDFFCEKGMTKKINLICRKYRAKWAGSWFITYISKRYFKKTLTKAEQEIEIYRLLKYSKYIEFWGAVSPLVVVATQRRFNQLFKQCYGFIAQKISFWHNR